MKKHIPLALCAIVMLLLAASCEREGVYSPGKKISMIYVDDGPGKKLDQFWTWKGKELQSITYPGKAVLTFRYNKKNQLDSILVSGLQYDYTEDLFNPATYFELTSYYILTYDQSGKHIEALDRYALDQAANRFVLMERYTFEYNTDGLISDYIYTKTVNHYHKEAVDSRMTDHVFNILFPELHGGDSPARISNRYEDNGPILRHSESYKETFCYSGGNVIHSLYKMLTPEINMYSYDYTYTQYQNPFFRMFQRGTPGSVDLYNRNLVKTCCIVDSILPDSVFVKDLCTWEYDIEDGYPVKATCNGKWFFENMENVGVPGETLDTSYYTRTYYYEYVK